MNAALVVAGTLTLLASAIHGGAGEVLVVRKLSPPALPSTRFGGGQMTKTMIQAAWHITTVAFLATGLGLVLAGTALEGDARQAIGVLGAAACTGFAGVVVALGLAQGRFIRTVRRHPAPLVLTLAAVLAWLGAV